MRRVAFTPLAVFAVSSAIAGILVQWELAGSAAWFVGAAAGIVIAVAWVREPRIGLALALASAVLFAIRLAAGDAETAPALLALMTGTSTGVLLGLGAAAAWRRVPRLTDLKERVATTMKRFVRAYFRTVGPKAHYIAVGLMLPVLAWSQWSPASYNALGRWLLGPVVILLVMTIPLRIFVHDGDRDETDPATRLTP